MTYTEYVDLVLSLLRHCYLYYELDQPEMSDYDYDRAYRKLVDFEETHTPLPYSPTQYVGFNHKKLGYE